MTRINLIEISQIKLTYSIFETLDSLKIDTIEQKTQKLEAKNALSSISISLKSRASSRARSKVNTKISPDRRMNSTNDIKFAKGVDLSQNERGRLPRTPLSPPQQNG